MKRRVALVTGVTGQDGAYLAEFLLQEAIRFMELKKILSPKYTKN